MLNINMYWLSGLVAIFLWQQYLLPASLSAQVSCCGSEQQMIKHGFSSYQTKTSSFLAKTNIILFQRSTLPASPSRSDIVAIPLTIHLISSKCSQIIEIKHFDNLVKMWSHPLHPQHIWCLGPCLRTWKINCSFFRACCTGQQMVNKWSANGHKWPANGQQMVNKWSMNGHGF